MTDQTTGQELAAVYIPTAPNPTSGYVEILPLEDLVFLDWTFDQAMSFIVTGGSNGPDTIDYSGMVAKTRPIPDEPEKADAPEQNPAIQQPSEPARH